MTDENKKTAAEKGNALEQAVREIESAILRIEPTAKEKPFNVEYKKIVVVDDVKHEIDVYVTVFFGPGYNSLFIFECKNWADPVGKNEIIIFSEKIKAVGATHGYFVAKAFTADAKAQANKDNRMTLRVATEHDPLAVADSYAVRQQVQNVEVSVRSRDGHLLGQWDGPLKFQYLGEATDLETLLREWTGIAGKEKMREFAEDKPDGVYDFKYEFVREFPPGDLEIGGKDVERIDVIVTGKAHVFRQAVEYCFDVEKRGMVIRFAPLEIPGLISVRDNSVVLLSPDKTKEM